MIIEVNRAAGVVCKRAETGEEIDRLRQEARVLEVARHPGVVRLLGSEDATVKLSMVDGESLSSWSPTSGDELDGIALSAATALADLHDIGVVHGAITAEHILIDSSGRPIFCSFGRGAINRATGGSDAAGDVACLAAVLLAQCEADGSLHRILTAAATSVTRGTGGRKRPPARRLAILLAATESQGLRRYPRGAVAATVAAATITAVLFPVVRSMGSTSPPPHRPACPPVDLGCQPLPHTAGIIRTKSGSYRIGGPDDIVVVGRWRCASALPAVLRPVTGEVWVWDSWARPNTALPARLLRRIPSARTMSVDPDLSGCDRMRVVRQDADPVVVNPAAPA